MMVPISSMLRPEVTLGDTWESVHVPNNFGGVG